MSEMPYGTLSSSMLWKVLYVMQCAETAGLETISTTCDTRSCIQALRGKTVDHILQRLKILSKLISRALMQLPELSFF